MKIMIVDDNADVRALLSLQLTTLGATPILCHDGMDAVEQYKLQNPDAVFMDIAMPEMDGLQATERIRSIDENACVYIVTAYSDDMLRRAARAAGAKGFYLKDNLESLFAQIRRQANSTRPV
ncbi:MAG: response regulator [Bacteroidetes bacterium]|nr:response regulator [Bacteroidota bacterium]